MEAGLRERKKMATRHALHFAALDLVEARGLSATTVEAISDRAGVAPRTFWGYFASKEDAVIDRDTGWAAAMREALLDRPATEDALTALRRVIEAALASRTTDSERFLRVQQLIRREPQLAAAAAAAFDEIERELVDAVAARLGLAADASLKPAVLVMAASGACRVALRRWAQSGGRRPFSALVQEAFAALHEGLEREPR